jgi:hypothetical protein
MHDDILFTRAVGAVLLRRDSERKLFTELLAQPKAKPPHRRRQ